MIGTYYYPEQWPAEEWAVDFQRMRAMGLRHVHMAEFAWAHLEPQEGRFDFDWLDKAVHLADQNDLNIILCTPTAAPPVWMAETYPETLMVRGDGRRVNHGSRAQRCVNVPDFNRLAEGISTELARRYGHHPRVIGWQLDNEIGHYENAPCYCPACETAFRRYLEEGYGDITILNRAWGGDFWSQNYQSFDQIPLPNPKALPHMPNEHALLDFRRFYSLSIARFLERQAALLRQHIRASAWITHNFVADDPFVFPRHVRQGLDLFTLTLYPVSGKFQGEPGTGQFRIGDPTAIAFHHDFTRAHNGRWGVMEQQPGQVNWGPYNCRPLPGAVRLWLWTAIAHGAELLDTYRFRQPRYGCEQYHEGLVQLDGEHLSAGGDAFARVAAELAELAPLWKAPAAREMGRAAILYDWDSLTALGIHPQTIDFDPVSAWRRYYRVLKQLGFEVDVLAPGQAASLSPYEVVCVPFVDLADDDWLASWQTYAEQGGHLVVSARTATRDRNGHFPKCRYGQRLMDLTGGRLVGYDVLPKGHTGRIETSDGDAHRWHIWGEQWQAPARATSLATYTDQFYAGACAAFQISVGQGSISLIGVDAGGLTETLVQRAIQRRLPDCQSLPAHCLYHTRGRLGIFLNYSDRTVAVPAHLHGNRPIRTGALRTPPADVCVWQLTPDVPEPAGNPGRG